MCGEAAWAFSRPAALPLKLRLPVRRREADHHLGSHAIQGTGIVPLTSGDGDRVAGVEEEFLLAEAVFEATGEQVQDFVAVRMAVTRVRLTGGDHHSAKSHRGGVPEFAGGQPGEFSPGLIDQNAFGRRANGRVVHGVIVSVRAGFGD